MMRATARLLGVAGLVVALACGATAETRLSIGQGRALAIQLVQNGQATAARAAALALLQRDPDDVVALIVLSRAERDLGAFKAAQKAARHAERVATRDEDRFGAALAMAQALASDGRRTAAQFWLRRATELAPDARARAVAVRDFTYVRSRNPLKARLSFGAFPSSNVNDGPTSNTLVVGGIEFVNPDAVPLSGLGFSVGGDLTWRLPAGKEAGFTLGLSADSTRYILSESARAQVPDASASDYATSGLSLSAGYDRRFGESVLSSTLRIGRDWQGGAALADWSQLSFGLQRSMDERHALSLALEVTDTRRKDSDIRSSQKIGGGVGWIWASEAGDRWASRLTLGTVQSDSAAIARREGELRLDWQRAAPVLGVELSAFATLGLAQYDRALPGLATRQDVNARLGVTALISKVDYMGFAPEVGLVLSGTNSNIPALTTRKAELRLGIRSTF
ncbi:hypothetical protein [Fuscibacter oryzae]|uniref:DUF560 domain-containing protein n=1 Tax=Fuscibacter oryzae TaxID=2803939 RepID=A0A8J7MPF2_9RHOB|nr:hypothetical protein [Fuscibacter oryzae]MBL4927283.1 hypothetical protein [Fuscibacter oryzae]